MQSFVFACKNGHSYQQAKKKSVMIFITGLYLISLRFTVSPCQPRKKPRSLDRYTVFQPFIQNCQAISCYEPPSAQQVQNLYRSDVFLQIDISEIYQKLFLFYWLLAKEVLNVWACPPHLTIGKSRKVFWSEIAKVPEWTQTALLRVFRSLFTASPIETHCTESHVLISPAFVRRAQKTWQTSSSLTFGGIRPL